MRKSRFDEWDRNYAYDVVKHEPVPFIYNDTGVLWEEKMGVDFTSASWYEDFEDIKEPHLQEHYQVRCSYSF